MRYGVEPPLISQVKKHDLIFWDRIHLFLALLKSYWKFWELRGALSSGSSQRTSGRPSKAQTTVGNPFRAEHTLNVSYYYGHQSRKSYCEVHRTEYKSPGQVIEEVYLFQHYLWLESGKPKGDSEELLSGAPCYLVVGKFTVLPRFCTALNLSFKQHIAKPCSNTCLRAPLNHQVFPSPYHMVRCGSRNPISNWQIPRPAFEDTPRNHSFTLPYLLIKARWLRHEHE